ncbi:hypothetical protein LKR43_05075 [Pusillimonas sp. MFBS29]|uniref:LysR substrate-binding domain-containing protein n=1 Tax=Pusillimonas sp. MFBS29 TaxID=2886690 RepID=UPI001D107BE1|nr:hypothetical protein [Pusillimonas sp. MFBS29]
MTVRPSRDYYKCKWLLPVSQVSTRQWIDHLFTNAGLSAPDVQLEVDASPVYFSGLIRNSDLVTAMSEDILAPLSGHGLTSLQVEGVEWSHNLQVIWRRTAYMSRVIADLREQLFNNCL